MVLSSLFFLNRQPIKQQQIMFFKFRKLIKYNVTT